MATSRSEFSPSRAKASLATGTQVVVRSGVRIEHIAVGLAQIAVRLARVRGTDAVAGRRHGRRISAEDIAAHLPADVHRSVMEVANIVQVVSGASRRQINSLFDVRQLVMNRKLFA